MGTISSGIGLISGIPIQQLVDSIIAGRSRSVQLLDSRIQRTTSLRTAYLDLSARVLAAKATLGLLKSESTFRATKATSSAENVLGVRVTGIASPGSYSFTVRSLASTQQVISSGFATRDATFLSPGTLTVERAEARLARGVDLSLLNDGAGVRGGRIRITDRAGGSAEIDLTGARTISDVVAAINAQSTAAVTASTQGDRLVLDDRSGATSGTLAVEDIGGGFTALDLGIRGSTGGSRLVGTDVLRLSLSTAVGLLNDGNGIRVHGVSDDFRVELADGSTIDVNLSGKLATDTALSILNGGTGVPAGRISITNRAGQSGEVDLSSAQTVGDVVSAIQSAGLNVSAAIVSSRLVLTDNSEGAGTFAVTEVNGGGTAAALGLTTAASGNTLNGRNIYRVATIGDVVRAVNADSQNGGRLLAEIDPGGDRLRLVDQTVGGGSFTVTALNDSRAAGDLGLLAPTVGSTLTSGRLLGGLATVLLRNLQGESGVGVAGLVELTDRSGATATIDLSGAETLDDVLGAINAAGVGLQARIGASGLGIEVVDTSGGSGVLRIADLTGALAGDLGIVVNTATGTVANSNLQRRYISENTRLEGFRAGVAFSRGRFRITDSGGASAVVDLTQGDEQTLGDVIAEINSRGIGVRASINATGDGLLLVDTAGGGGRLTVAEEGGATARSLGILGSAAAGTDFIDGSLERSITVTASDTLDTLSARIRESGAALNVAILNDGSSVAPYRLSLTSTISGEPGRFAFDAGTTGLSFATLVEGRNATVVYGAPGAAQGIVLTSTSNTLSDAIPGVSLSLVSASETPVSIDITEDPSAAADAVKAFVDALNTVIDRIAEASRFNATTNQRGVLLGDSVASRISARLQQAISLVSPGATPGVDRLSAIGVRFGAGGKLTFDRARFEEVFARDPEAVRNLLMREESGLAARIESQLDDITGSENGFLTRAGDGLGKTLEILSSRKQQVSERLERERQTLLTRFQATERVLSRLQSQQSTLTSFTSALQFPSNR